MPRNSVHRAWTGHDLPRLTLPAGVVRSHLMDESEKRLAAAASSGIPDEELVAGRLLGDVPLYCRWESEHDAILRSFTEDSSRAPTARLVAAALALVHRKALFQLLKDRRIRGEQRTVLVRQFFGSCDYERLILREHGIYLRSSASFLCVTHVGTRILANPLFGQPVLDYEELYAEYFSLLADVMLDSPQDPLMTYNRSLLRSLKRRLDLGRSILLRRAADPYTTPTGLPALRH